MEVNWGVAAKEGDLHRYLLKRGNTRTKYLLQYGRHLDMGELLVFPKRAPMPVLTGTLGPAGVRGGLQVRCHGCGHTLLLVFAGYVNDRYSCAFGHCSFSVV